jgi:hypothetical protein
MVPPVSLAAGRLNNRRELLKHVDQLQKSAELDANTRAKTVNVFRQKAFELMTSPKVTEAFDLEKESEQTRDAYGRHTWGQSVLLSRRLIESGVRCVTVEHSNWDTHDNNSSVSATCCRSLIRQVHAVPRPGGAGVIGQNAGHRTGEFPGSQQERRPRSLGPSFTVALGGGG